jgi:polyphosphate glucokinase
MNVLGVDIGGTGIKGAIVDVETGKLVSDRHRLPTPEYAKPEDVAAVVAELAHHFEWKGSAGSGFPGVVIQGVTLTAANVDVGWINLSAADLLSNAGGCKFRVLNDADAAGLAEMTFGAGKGENGVVLLLTLGTGLGTAIFTNGVLLPNTELGHLQIRGKDAERRASDAARKRKNWTWEDWALRVQEYLSAMEALFWPDLIIIGGGVSKKSDIFFPMLQTRAKMVPAELLNDAGIIGAAIFGGKEEG